MRNVSEKVVEKIKTHFLLNNIFLKTKINQQNAQINSGLIYY